MMETGEALVIVWAVLLALAVTMYVLLDGFDLGIGILFPFAKSDEHRDIMMQSVAPIWDGNETWLILGGGGLFVVFPLAYALLMPALYLLILFMLIMLVFRGVAFEFRFKARTSRFLWDWSFALGSSLATFAQGMVLGAFIQGFDVDLQQRSFVGGPFDWFSPFSLFTGVSLMAGYAALGAGWLIMKTEGDLQQWARKLMLPLAGAMLVLIGAVSLWTPLLSEEIFRRWFSWENLAWLWPVPLAVVICAGGLAWAVRTGRELLPFLFTMGLFLLSFIGLGVSLWPYIVPLDVTIWDAAAPPASLIFFLVGAAVLLPVVLGYTAYTYWVFRGKVRPAEGY
ncbi:MAG: cytochrome d ubiquinol oxidase subunit II [Alphaproteobacteria bacterium]